MAKTVFVISKINGVRGGHEGRHPWKVFKDLMKAQAAITSEINKLRQGDDKVTTDIDIYGLPFVEIEKGDMYTYFTVEKVEYIK